ncbi:M15 family metallopeptidase [Pseudosulfitobacter pseudonitzschiae]|uniref:M15 family metallopeptidase n=1 Tax=Pseudosulfitobacter pseudonitzschiae TaxID=1402135 RepID=UPI003B80FB82
MKILKTSILAAAMISLALPSLACDMPLSEGREDLYGHTSNPSGIDGLNSDFRDSVAAMMDAAASELGGSMHIYSGYRSVEHQQRLWDEAAVKYPDPEVRDNWVARPGSSMHNYGLAVDLRWNGARIEYGSPISDWMAVNSERFGLARPLGNEGWHVEPIGGRANKDELLSGAPLECQEMSGEVGEIPPVVLMPWESSVRWN